MTIAFATFNSSISLSSIPINNLQAKLSSGANDGDMDVAAELVFMGKVIPNSMCNGKEGRRVIGIDYGIERSEFEKKCEEIIEAVHLAIPDIIAVHIIHRTGFVSTGDYTVIVSVSSRHRTSAAMAIDIIVGRIKGETVMKKKEIFSCG
jgi:molybdopterin synthase catalytic subunit